MIEVNNLETFLELMDFSEENKFYYMQIIQRGKDGAVEFAGKNNKHRMLRAYSIFSKQELIDKFDKIKSICKDNNARAYIHVNRRDSVQTTLEMIKRAVRLLQDGNTKASFNSWDSCCGYTRDSKGTKYTLIDIDCKDLQVVQKYIDIYLDTRGAEKKYYIMETVNGYHIIATAFDTKLFKQKCVIAGLPDVDIHKDSPTLLYYSK